MDTATTEQIVIQKILYLLFIICTGYLAGRTSVISEEGSKTLAKLIFNITFPLLIFTTFATKGLTSELLLNCGWTFVLAWFALGLLLLIGTLSAKLQKMPEFKASIHVLHTVFGNVAFLGFPVIDSIYGSDGLLYASIFILASDTLLWTYGVYRLRRGDIASLKQGIKHLINPNMISLGLGLAAMLLQIKVPRIVLEPAKDIGHVTIIVSMLYIGAMLSYMKVHHIFKHPHVFALCFNKLILVPSILIVSLRLLTTIMGLSIEALPINVVVLEAGMPAMASVVILASLYDGDYEQASENALATTLFSMVSIPVLIYLMRIFN